MSNQIKAGLVFTFSKQYTSVFFIIFTFVCFETTGIIRNIKCQNLFTWFSSKVLNRDLDK